jgi:hypothetical protein
VQPTALRFAPLRYNFPLRPLSVVRAFSALPSPKALVNPAVRIVRGLLGGQLLLHPSHSGAEAVFRLEPPSGCGAFKPGFPGFAAL